MKKDIIKKLTQKIQTILKTLLELFSGLDLNCFVILTFS